MKTTPLVLAALVAGLLAAQDAKVTPLISKEIKELPGKESLMMHMTFLTRSGPDKSR